MQLVNSEESWWFFWSECVFGCQLLKELPEAESSQEGDDSL